MINGMIAFEAKEIKHDPKERVVELETALLKAYRMIGALDEKVESLTARAIKAETEVEKLSLDLGLNQK